MKLKLRWLSGLFSAMGLGYFIYQGSANYIVLSLIMFSFSAFVITFANMTMNVNKTHEINMIEKHIESKDNAGGYFVTKKDLFLVILAFLICCGASFIAGRTSTTQVPIDINQTTVVNNVSEVIEKVNINEASFEELQSLQGVGSVKSDLIIKNRPYDTIYGLLDKKVIGEDTFNVIKGGITVE